MTDQHWQPIAIIGMSGAFPGAKSVDEFWNNVRNGVGSVQRIPEAMVDARRDPRGELPKSFVPMGTFLADTEWFDHRHFGLSLRDAKLMDPQQRLFIEHSWAAAENAGYDPGRLGERVSVYAGGGPSRHVLDALDAFGHDYGTLFEVVATGVANAMAMRVSYLFGYSGESVYLYTACSTTLAAVDLACRSLIDGRSDVALAGGTALWLPQGEGYEHVPGMILSADGQCRAFDASASGTIWSNGVAVVVLKLLSSAIRDGDPVRAVIVGSSMNNDGSRQKLSFAAPSAEGQADCIARAYRESGIAPSSVSFLEAHGTGTVVGDPLEVEGLNLAFSEVTARRSCALGSVKTNVGHLDPVAGLASVIKVVGALEHREIPPTLHFQAPSPAIPFDAGPFFVNAELLPWTTEKLPRRAGVNSFGVGGTNCHVILEEAPARGASQSSQRPRELVTFSARSESALGKMLAEFAAWYRDAGGVNPGGTQAWSLADVAYTRALGRKEHDVRASFAARDAADLIARIERRQASRPELASGSQRVVFVFPGQGALTVGSTREIYDAEPDFRADVDECAEVLKEMLDTDIRQILYPDAASQAWAEQQIVETRFTQPCLFVLEWALARQLGRWGVTPSAMLGHSVGEYVAACLSGVLTPADSLALLVERGRLVQTTERGAMLALPLPAAKAIELLGPDLDLAAENSPTQCVVSGSEAAIAALEQRLARATGAVRLRTSHAFHSRLLEPIARAFGEALEQVKLSSAAIPYVSNVTGTWVTPADAASPRYWLRHLRGSVKFNQGLRCLLDAGYTTFVEVGPGQTLLGLLREQLAERDGKASVYAGSTTARSGRGRGSDYDALLGTLGALWERRVPVDFKAYFAGQKRRRVPLPGYPFEKAWCALYAPGEEFKLVERALGAQRLGGERLGGERAGGGRVGGPGGEAAVDTGAPGSTEPARDAAASPAPAAGGFDDEHRIGEVFARALGLPAIAPEENFVELGVQSLMLVSVSNHLRAMFDVAISTREILENPTPRQLADRIRALVSAARTNPIGEES